MKTEKMQYALQLLHDLHDASNGDAVAGLTKAEIDGMFQELSEATDEGKRTELRFVGQYEQQPKFVVEVLKTIEAIVTSKWTAQDGSEGFGSAPNIVSDAVYERLLEISDFFEPISDNHESEASEQFAMAAADLAQRLVEHFVIAANKDLTYL